MFKIKIQKKTQEWRVYNDETEKILKRGHVIRIKSSPTVFAIQEVMEMGSYSVHVIVEIMSRKNLSPKPLRLINGDEYRIIGENSKF